MNREEIIKILLKYEIPFEVAENIAIELEGEFDEIISNIYTDCQDSQEL